MNINDGERAKIESMLMTTMALRIKELEGEK